MACIGDGSVLAGGRSIVANRYLEETTDPSCSFWNLPNIWILLLLLLWLCAYYCLNKEREGVQFSELGMGTTALQDGSLPACTRSCPSCKAFLLSSSPIGGDFSATQGPLARRRERLMGAEALYWCRWFSQGKESSSVAGGGGCPWSPKQELTLKMQGRLEEQLPSLRMASVGGCGKTTSGLPPITVSLHDSRSLHGSIRCLLDGVSKHSRTLREDRAYLLLCLLETQLPAMWRFETGGCNLFSGYPR